MTTAPDRPVASAPTRCGPRWSRWALALIACGLGGWQPATLAGTVPAASLVAESPAATALAASAPQPAAKLLALQSWGDAGPTPVFAEVFVNGRKFGELLMLQQPPGHWLASAEDVRRWTLKPPLPSSALSYRGQSFFALDAYTGYQARFDAVLQRLELQFTAPAFVGEKINWGSNTALPTRPGYGAYVNYDFLLSSQTRQPAAARQSTTLGGLFELVVYAPLGRLEANLVAPTLLGGADGARRKVQRLNTTWVSDDPARRASLQLGDVVGSSGLGGAPLRFGGIRYGSNFATQPGFVTQPVLSFAGQTSTPSVVDLYINGQRSRRSELPAGPFAINDIAALSGQGEARLVVTDALGREQVYSQSYLSSGRLLRTGLSEFSFEAGLLREEGGGSDNTYGPAVALGQWRHGFTNALTQEFRLALSEDVSQVGTGLTFGEASVGVYGLSVLASKSTIGDGALLMASAQQRFAQRLSLSASLQVADREFRQVGQAEGRPPALRTAVVAANYSFGRGTNVGASYALQVPRDAAPLKVFSSQISRSFGRLFAVLSAALRQGETDETELRLSVGYRFGSQGGGVDSELVSRSSRQGADSRRALIRAQQGLGAEVLGTGWSLEAEHNSQSGSSSERYAAAGVWNGPVGSLEGQFAHTENTDAWRLNTSGAVGLLGSRAFVSRRTRRSLGIIDEPALAGLAVLVNGQVSTRLDAHGRGILPSLNPYLTNTISADLTAASYELVVAEPILQLVPANRAGYRVLLGAQLLYGAILKLVAADGHTPIRPGALLSLEGIAEPFVVADRGEVYISSTQRAPLKAVLRHGDLVCALAIDLGSAKPDHLTTLGPYPCANSAP